MRRRDKMMKFIDLDRQYNIVGKEIEERMRHVIENKQFIMGPEIGELENALAGYTGRKHAITCASGTDALVIPLMALELEKKDAVFVPAFTFFASAESVVLAGATPVFVDCDSSYNMDTDNLILQIEKVLKEGKLVPRGIIPVDLFGQPADYEALEKIAEKYDLFILEDAAQGFGGIYKGKKACSFGKVSATSFFPAKPLGCYGDGGAIFTDDDEFAEKLKSVRVHGMGTDRYDNIRIGLNGRMDALQAAVVIPKLKIFDEEMEKRNKVAKRYTENLKDDFIVPVIPEDKVSSWAQFSLLAETKEQREKILEKMKEKEIPIMIYYPIPMHLQTAFQYLGYRKGDLPQCEDYADRIFSIPMHPYLTEEEIDFVSEALIAAKR
jgi:dTDP-4-amino-4,6-dideoxygalactose transaminase